MPSIPERRVQGSAIQRIPARTVFPGEHRSLIALCRYSSTAPVPREGLVALRGPDAVEADGDDGRR
ncbi:hypothetical protein [Streptomyces sp. NPDC001980]|uniref:hypothetical protein n=1 Tax=Streptomyces sp. NPDC001980 TaxID=3157126 RepID=UPI003333E406